MSKRFFTTASSIFNRILDGTALLSGALIIFLIIIVCCEVALRYFFNRPTTWVTEFGAYIMLWAPFLVAAYVLRAGKHVTMDMLLQSLGSRAQRILNLMTSSLAVIACVLITFFGIRVVVELYQTGERTETYLMLTKWPLMAIIPLSTFFLLIELLRRLCLLLAVGEENRVIEESMKEKTNS